MSDPLLRFRIALITGATHGIGRSVALGFAKEGAHVICAGRDQKALEELDNEVTYLGGKATLVRIDLRNGMAIDRLGQNIMERWKRLDILVGNAGVLGPMSPISHIDPSAWDNLVAVNLTANYRLLRAMDLPLKQSESGRAIFVTSGAATGDAPFWGAYGATKAALERMVKSYASENAKTRICANLINPGATRTAMRAQAMPGENPNTLPHPDELVPLFVRLAREGFNQNGQIFNFRD